jgi:DNA helicase TIP49 (TBP-interacting protein)
MNKTLSSHVQINTRFVRSIRIDADYGRTDALEGFVLQPSALSALEVMARHINESQQRAFTWTGPYGSGKSSLALAVS